MTIIPIPGFSEPFSSICHLIAAFFFLIAGGSLLFRGHGNAYRLFGHSVYTFSLVFLFSMSGVYHLLEPGGVARMTLQRLDHAGIYVLIAGTFTAVHFTFFNRKKRWIISTFVWILSITGLVLTVIFMKNMPQLLLSAFYLGLGWIGIFTGYFLYSNYGFNTFRPLLLGGCVYSIGAIIMYLDWPVLWPGVIQAHEIFHVAVIIAAYTHWKLVYQWSANPSSHRLTFIVRKRGSNKFLAKAATEKFFVKGTSLNEIKEKIRDVINKEYHPSMLPISIRLKISNEDVFYIGERGIEE